MTRRVLGAGTCLLAAIATVGACAVATSTATESAPKTAAPTITRVPKLVDESDRPQVPFGPYLDIPDDVVTDAVYDPRSEAMSDFAATRHTILGCSYKGTVQIPGVLARYDLTVMSANSTFKVEQEKTADYAVPTEFAGRRALLKIDPSAALQLRHERGNVIRRSDDPAHPLPRQQRTASGVAMVRRP